MQRIGKTADVGGYRSEVRPPNPKREGGGVYAVAVSFGIVVTLCLGLIALLLAFAGVAWAWGVLVRQVGGG